MHVGSMNRRAELNAQGQMAQRFGKVDLWHFDMGSPRLPQSSLLAALSEDERQRMESSRTGLNFALCRGTLRHLLSQYLAVDPQQIVFSYTPLGKPYLPAQAGTDLEFSLSHSGDQLVCAIGLRQKGSSAAATTAAPPAISLGVDIECVTPLRHLDGLIKRCLAPEEQAATAAGSVKPQAARFLQYWVCKEAYVKAIGIGLRVPFAAIAVQLEPSPRFVRLPEASPSDWQLHLWQPTDKAVVALAYSGAPATVDIRASTEAIEIVF